MNPVVGVVGVFNLQGSSWDRVKRRFYIHSRKNPALSTQVGPYDVDLFRTQDEGAAAAGGEAALAEGGAGSSSSGGGSNGKGGAELVGEVAAVSGNGSSTSSSSSNGASAADAAATAVAGDSKRRYACYCYSTGELQVVEGGVSQEVALAHARGELFWISPVVQAGGVEFAPLGLTGMYNGGGAVQSCTVVAGQEAQATAEKLATTTAAATADAGGSTSRGSVTAAAAAGLKASSEVVASMQVRGCGAMLMYCSKRPHAVWINLAPRDFEYNEYTKELRVEVPLVEGLRSEVLVRL